MFDEDNYLDYDSIARDCDDLYYDDEYDSWDNEDIENVEQNEWENYFFNVTDELTDE